MKAKKIIKGTATLLASTIMLESCHVNTILQEEDIDARYKVSSPQVNLSAVKISDNLPYMRVCQQLFQKLTSDSREAQRFLADQRSYISSLNIKDKAVEDVLIKDEGLLATIRLLADSRLEYLIRHNDVVGYVERVRSLGIQDAISSEFLKKVHEEAFQNQELMDAIHVLMGNPQKQEEQRSVRRAGMRYDELDVDASAVAVAVSFLAIVGVVVYLGAVAVNWAGAINAVFATFVATTQHGIIGYSGLEATQDTMTARVWLSKGGGIKGLSEVQDLEKSNRVDDFVEKLEVLYPGSVPHDKAKDVVRKILSHYV